MIELPDITAAIADGHFDGQLDDLVLAVVARARTGAVEFKWRLRYQDDEWTQDTVTLGELRFAEQHCKITGPDGLSRRAVAVEIDPRSSAEHALALIVAHLHKVGGLPLRDATTAAEKITAAELADIVGEYEVVRPPSDGSTPEASTSS